MSNYIDFKKLWQQQETNIPEIKDLLKRANRFKRINLFKLVFVNIVLILTVAFMVYIWFNYQSKFVTTKIGILLAVFAMFILFISFNTIIPLLIKKDLDIKLYLQQLLKLKEKQLFLHAKIMAVYLVFLSLGVCLYIYEFVLKMPVFWGIFTYMATLSWIAISWFYLRPKAIKKEQGKVNKLIDKFKELSEQLTN